MPTTTSPDVEHLTDSVVEGTAPRPWIRFGARVIDFSLYVPITLLLLVPVTLLIQRFTGYETAVQISGMLYLGALYGFWVVLESLVLACFGTTPGKWLLRIVVTTEDGEKLSPRQAVVRTMNVFVRGLALGIPILSFLTMGWAWFRLSSQGVTSWDKDSQLKVTHGSIGPLRMVVAVVCWLVLVGLRLQSLFL